MTTTLTTPRSTRERRTRAILREMAWSCAALILLVVRMVATLTTPLLVIGWIIVAIRSDLYNGWFWPAVGSAAALLIATVLYSSLNAR